MRSVKDIFRSWAVFKDGVHVDGTDKESNHHYGDAYESLFPDRESVKLVLEVGVSTGECLHAWREVFPNATIVGMDIHTADRWDGEFYLGDQSSLEDCERVTAGRQFDLIVDDATHTLEGNLSTLLWMWPAVKVGGFYVVEEFYTIDDPRMRTAVATLFPFAQFLETLGPGGAEYLTVMRKLCST